ncbi:MAG: hypothetical protein ACI4KH_03980 [Oscillospiraceae bacterium]
MNMENAVKDLLKAYSEIFAEQGAPEWAFHKIEKPEEYIHPSIPFVGKDYFEQKHKILVYASAENLSKYDGRIDDDEKAKNRHRWYFENESNSETEFPDVHMQPMDDGGLAVVAMYFLEKLGYLTDDNITPKQFLETLSFGNFSKFTYEGSKTKNEDKATDSDILSKSIDYIKTDLAVLKPDYVIMPQSIYKTLRRRIDEIKGDIKIIGIYQINNRVVNCTINKIYKDKKVPKESLNTAIASFYEKIQYNKRENFLSVFPYLDKVFDDIFEKNKISINR